eukprot:2180873-Rhodomonas_salina.1
MQPAHTQLVGGVADNSGHVKTRIFRWHAPQHVERGTVGNPSDASSRIQVLGVGVRLPGR